MMVTNALPVRRMVEPGFSLWLVSADGGDFHFLRFNWGLSILSTIPVFFFFNFLLGRVNIAVCIPTSGNEECALASNAFSRQSIGRPSDYSATRYAL